MESFMMIDMCVKRLENLEVKASEFGREDWAEKKAPG